MLQKALFRRALTSPQSNAFSFLDATIDIQQSATFGDVVERSYAAGALISQFAQKGDRVLVLYAPNASFNFSVLGCICAGAIAVPVRPPTGPRSIAPFLRIANDCKPQVIVAPVELVDFVGSDPNVGSYLSDTRWISFDEINSAIAETWEPVSGKSEDIAVLQYTSGSTRDPRGVMLSHANIESNLRMLAVALAPDETSKTISWLPLFHDMGLIGVLFGSLYTGMPVLYMSPADFIKDPMSWLRAIDKYKCTGTAAPNFALELCMQQSSPAERKAINLSTLRALIVGSEPIRSRTVERFCEAFAASGLKKSAIFTAYGLAESTAFATGSVHDAESLVVYFDGPALSLGQAIQTSGSEPLARPLVPCGRTHQELKIRIVDPVDRQTLGEGQVGEIWISGASVSAGYWNRQEESAQVFGIQLTDDIQQNFLRTGDYGFFWKGQLFVTGRIKDTIVVRGQNIYPSDIEATVESVHRGPGFNSTAAFALESDDGEELAILHEVADAESLNLENLMTTIRKAISLEHQIQAACIVLVKEKSLLRTSSGKLRRSASRQRFLDGEIHIIANSTINSELSLPGNIYNPTLHAAGNDQCADGQASSASSDTLNRAPTIYEKALNVRRQHKARESEGEEHHVTSE